MLLTCDYQGYSYSFLIQWTSADGQSIVFRDIVEKVADQHNLDASAYLDLAEHLDILTDKLYTQIYAFTNEYEAIPFDPRFRRVILQSLSEVHESVQECKELEDQNHNSLLSSLFSTIADKLRELVDVYLAERAYQSKYHKRLQKKEQYIETTPQKELAFEFEDVLLQMSEISRQMKCLSETQRRRLVKHIFLNYTFQEIADSEHVAYQSVQDSVISALKKIKQSLL
jgi:hypothetical protein